MVVLDSWALLAYLKNEPPAERIESKWLAGSPAISSINLGETLYMRIRDRGEKSAAKEIRKIRKRSTIIDPDWVLVSAAARIKAGGGLSYADAFCIATAQQLDVSLWTGDPEIIGKADEFSCKIVDLRGTPQD